MCHSLLINKFVHIVGLELVMYTQHELHSLYNIEKVCISDQANITLILRLHQRLTVSFTG